tara:strand:+ start:1244 stop:1489 length:246 start_codon:yes stop_codon:yes gene_type:complete
MTNDKIFEEISNIISKTLNIKVNDLNLNSGKNNILKWDSLNQVKIILAIEEKYKIKFGTDNFEDLNNIKKIVEVVSEKISS